ncbi:MAG TPA: T9SS type A sorting domain-containing protein, partial [Puia sp.]|nr:T9SS type A sorting domain-containing protein [Puia sp.]
ATYTVNSDTSITAIVSKGSSGDVAVNTSNGTTSKTGFQYILSDADSVFSLIQFTGALANTTVQLEWKTIFEKPISKYIVEYSKDSTQFLAIDSLNNSGVGSYQYNDTRKLDSNNYYRLKIVDTAGNFTFSYVVFIHIPVVIPPRPNGLILNPNPAHGSIVIKLPVSNNISSLTISNMMGKQVQSISLPPNASQVTIDLSTLQPGIYIIVWRNGSQVYKQSLLVK